MSELPATEMVLVLADVTGYTRFMTANQKSLAHSQLIISELIKAILKEVDLPLQVAKLEGDAVLMYAIKGDGTGQSDEAKGRLGAKLLEFFRVFSHKIAELTLHSICKCDACTNISHLQLKIIAHSGQAVFYQNEFNNTADLSSVDVIIAHRLLKNSVELGQYLLLTEQASRDIELGDLPATPWEETYEELGTIQAHVYPAPKVEPPKLDSKAPHPYDSIFVATLRDEVQREYAQVASEPEKGFHFHTGRRAVEKAGYLDEWLKGIPESSIESFAGTGNPFSLGVLQPGENVVDVGCGAGMDSLIAAKMVGPMGKVIGLDMTPAMINKARRSAAELGVSNVEFREGLAEYLPLADGWADVIISNGVINLVPDKARAYGEMRRVLKAGGRLQIGDILVEKAVPESAKKNIDLWSS